MSTALQAYVSHLRVEKSSYGQYYRENWSAMLKDEVRCLPKPNFLSTVQRGYIKPYMRHTIIEWLFSVAHRHLLEAQIVARATNYIDRYLSAIAVNRHNFQVLALASLYLAGKMDRVASVPHLSLETISGVTETDVWFAERSILETLRWDMAAVTPHMVLARVCNVVSDPAAAAELFVKSATYANVALLRYDLSWAPASVIAVGALICGAADLAVTLSSISAQLRGLGVDVDRAESVAEVLREVMEESSQSGSACSVS
ncbi:Cyclin N-terminal domain [Carpediemonas membranifera]|uniref:Cyclin N-terminal domain n=1 Tax=Carpediemonas membranifera TaxID=201153 RepID=A0A8J6B4Z8_9EUKA|nr:Cyclin N-terminal domain [Carpediemonas membranifera]|eukprot:KAG9395793.1 Cyclin N-terminal domain [Carpediemonas membranifera]